MSTFLVSSGTKRKGPYCPVFHDIFMLLMDLDIFSKLHFAMVVEVQLQANNNGLRADRFGNTSISWKYVNPKYISVNKLND